MLDDHFRLKRRLRINNAEDGQLFFISTPSRNYAEYIPDAIESVRMQGIPRLRHHIQDACSSDRTEVAVSSHSWDGLTFSSEPDAGQSDAVNKAMALYGGQDYVGWLNADELYLTGALHLVSRVFQRNPDIDIVYGDSIHVDRNGRPVRLVAQHGFCARVLTTYGTYIQTASTFFRSRIVENGDFWLDPRYRQVMDLELFTRLHFAGYKFKHIPVPLSAFRVHDRQMTRINGQEIADAERSSIAVMKNGRISTTTGRALHAGLKAVSGCYFRENRYRARI